MNKKKIIYLILIVIIVLVLTNLLILLLNSKTNNLNNKGITKFENVINNKKDAIICIYNSKKDDGLSNYNISFFKDILNLDILYLDVGKVSKNEIFNLLSKIITDVPDNVAVPSVLFIKKGRVYSIANEVTSDKTLKEMLNKSGYMSDEEYNIDETVYEEDTFLNELSSNENYQLILLSKFSTDSFNYRKKLWHLAKNNKFSFYVTYNGIGTSYFYEDLQKNNKIENNDNNLLITKGNNIIDNLVYDDIDKLEEFLKKYNFIK